MTEATAYTEDEPLLRIEKVSKSYGDRLILREVSATIRDIHREGQVTGQIVGFLGPSGSGKTTLFRIMAGLESPSSGQVRLDSQLLPVRAGQVGVVAQAYPLFDHRTVWGNLLLTHRPATEIQGYLQDFDLADCKDKYPAQLSGGQRQRAAIIQQVLAGSSLILYDEPFSGLDPIAKRKTEQLIHKIANLTETSTAVIVTHDVRSALAIADHLWLLGTDRATNGSRIPGAYIKEEINLISAGLCWHPEIREMKEFAEMVVEVERKFLEL